MVLKCKICGGSLAFEQGVSVATCEYCGNKQTVPVVRDERVVLEMYEKANAYRMSYEFDNAINLYNQIILENKFDAEAYWDLALCKYGVVYVKDPNTGKYIPTCSRAQYDSILEDENYKKALEYADESQKAVFLNDAKYIDEVEKSIIKIAKSEEPFDVFICYKETDDRGYRTFDSVNAQKIYNLLTEAGYKVFYSKYTLESKVGIEYEPYIYAALSSSKVMIHITSSQKNSEAVWVKNEWSRYLALMQKDSEKTLIPIYFDMNKNDLPIEFRNIPSYNFNDDGFEDELLRGIKKIIPQPVGTQGHVNWVVPVIISVLCVVGIGIGAFVYASKKADQKTAEAIATATTTTIPQETEDPEMRAAYDAAVDLAYEGRYAEAAWAFSELGDFSDASSQYEQMLKSWRLSLSNVVAPIEISGVSYGTYYINGNGSVDCFSTDPGSMGQNYQINEHGRVVSITSGMELDAIREDGNVDGYDINDAIEISSLINMYDPYDSSNSGENSLIIVLHADGTVSYIDNTDEDDDNYNSEWLECLSDWNDVIDIVCCTECNGPHDYTVVADVVGLKSDGTLVYTSMPYYENGEYCIGGNTPNWVDQFNNVVRIGISDNTPILYLDDGTVFITSTGETINSDNTDIVSLLLYTDYMDDSSRYIYMNSDGSVINEYNEQQLSDIAYLRDFYAVSNTGRIYTYSSSNMDFVETTSVTMVPNEWLARLN